MKGGSVAEILIGLAYNGTTGRLSVEIIKGSHFRGGGGNDTKPPDTYVKLALIDTNNHEMGRSKTGLKRAQPNPLYKETFIFQVTFVKPLTSSFFIPLSVAHQMKIITLQLTIDSWRHLCIYAFCKWSYFYRMLYTRCIHIINYVYFSFAGLKS